MEEDIRGKGVRKGGVGVTHLPLSLIFYKNFNICAKGINCFRLYLLVDLLTLECKYHGMNLHANFKEHCKWAKK